MQEVEKASPAVTAAMESLEQAGLVRREENISAHTTLRVGGSARWWAEPQTIEELTAVLAAVQQSGTPLRVIGGGSNLIACQARFEGLVLKLGAGFAWNRVEGNRLIAGGAMLLPKLAHVANQNALGNFEWACGIPGTVGGSIWGNAGARGFNGENFESRDAAADLESVMVCDRAGNLRRLNRGDIDFGYRHSSLGDLLVVEATFALRPLDAAQTERHKQAIAELLKIRRETQPVSTASAGCIWKNPVITDGPFAGCRGAGDLIERLGLKGHTSGRAAISETHANFIINTGGATADDVHALMASVENIAWLEAGVRLEREARLLD